MSKPESEAARRALSIAAALASADPGEKAAARRMGPAGSALFWRLVVRLGIPRSQEAKWRLFTQIVALMTPASRETSIHEAGRHLGAVLADGGDRHKALNTPEAKPAVSEARMARLLAARGDARDEALARIIRMLARRVESLDVTDLASAILWPADTNKLARRYYERLDHSPTKEPEDA